MATRLTYRNDLNAKIVAIEDSGYGDFEFADDELNIYLELSVARLYPALYKKEVLSSQSPVSYGTKSYSKLDTPYADRVFLVVDSNEQEPIVGWRVVGDSLVRLDLLGLSGLIDVHYHDAYTFPSNDIDTVEVPNTWRPVIVLGALIEALESRQDSGVRGDPAPLGNNVEVPLLDRLVSRYEALKAEMAMSLPVMYF